MIDCLKKLSRGLAARALRAALPALALAIGASSAAFEAKAAVWQHETEWNEEWEQRFIEWVTRDWTKDYFTDQTRPEAFGIELDCADAVYAMRILFAYHHRLPFVINDPRKPGRTLSNSMTAWDGRRDKLREELDDGTWRSYLGPEYNETDKLRAFIDFVSDITNTNTLAWDTYPVALDDLQPGDIFLVPGTHAYMITDVAPTGAITTLSASSPKAWRAFAEIADFPDHMPKDKKKRDGYRRFKPASLLQKPAMSVPGASAEQWKVAASVDYDQSAFALMTQTALASMKEPLDMRAQRSFESLCDYVLQRVEIVNVAQGHLQRMKENEGRNCMSIYEYGEYSTPQRDKRLTGMFKSLRALMRDPDWNYANFPLKYAITAIFDPASAPMDDRTLGSYCSAPIDVLTGRAMNLRNIWDAIEGDLMSSDPHAPLDYRWGVGDGEWKPKCKVARG